MSNLVLLERDGHAVGSVPMSNAQTYAVVCRLVLAASRLAGEAPDQRLVASLADRGDQGVRGNGCAQLSLQAFAWDPGRLEPQKRLMLSAVDQAIQAPDWTTLGFEPAPEAVAWQNETLRSIQALIAELRPSDLQPDPEWTPVEDIRFCPTHEVVEHAGGCVVCNDR